MEALKQIKAAGPKSHAEDWRGGCKCEYQSPKSRSPAKQKHHLVSHPTDIIISEVYQDSSHAPYANWLLFFKLLIIFVLIFLPEYSFLLLLIC